MGLTIERSGDSEIAMLKLAGSLDASGEEAFNNAVQDAIRTYGTKRLVLSVEKLDFISSAGWSMFVETTMELRDGGGELWLSGMSETARRIYNLMGLEAFLKYFESDPKEAADYV